MERVILQFMCVGSLAGVTYLRYTLLTSPNKGETAVHCCTPPLLVLVMLVSRNVFHVVSALQPYLYIKYEYESDFAGSTISRHIPISSHEPRLSLPKTNMKSEGSGNVSHSYPISCSLSHINTMM